MRIFQAGAHVGWIAAVIVISGLAAGKAQDAPTNPQDELKAQIVEWREKVEGSDLEETFKGPAMEALDEAATRLQQAQGFRQQAAVLTKDAPSDPAELERLETELKQLPETKDEPLEMPQDVDRLRARLEAERAAVAQTSSELETAESTLLALRELPVKVANRLPEAKAEVTQKKAKLALIGDPQELSLAANADRLQLEAEITALESEIELLEKQQVGHPTREGIAEAKAELLAARLDRLKDHVTAFETELNLRLESEVDQMRDQVSTVIETVDDPEIVELAEGLKPLVAQLDETTNAIKATVSRLEATGKRLDQLKKESQRLRRQVELGGQDGAFSQVLLDRQRRLEDRRSLDFELRQLDRELSDAQLEGFRLEDEQADLGTMREHWEENAEALGVIEVRASLVERLLNNQRALVGDLARLTADKRAFRDLSHEFAQFLSEQLFLSRSSSPVGPKFFEQLPSTIRWAMSPSHWRELARALVLIPTRHPVSMSVVVLVVTALVVCRRRLKRSIRERSKRIRRISTDRLGHTIRALVETLLLALPVPMLMAFTAWALSSQPWADPWVRGFSSWLGWASWALMWVFSLTELASDDGVGQVHFGWKKEPSARLRSSLKWIAACYLPTLLLSGLTVFESNPSYFDSLGRLGFMIGQCVMAWAFWRMFHPSMGVFSDIIRERPERLLSKGRYVWIGIASGFPLALALMAALGYGITALLLSEFFHVAMRWVAVGVVVYGLLLRWLMIRARRLGLQEAIARRKARQESQAEAEDEDEEFRGETVSVEDAEVEMDLKSVAQQMRRLLRSLIGIGVLLGMVYAAASMLPLAQVSSAKVEGVSWLGLAKAVLIGAVALTVIRNLPGFVDLAGMRALGVAPGVRYAVTTLGQYAVGAVADRKSTRL
ncbi:MAG: hypothetical protein ACQKBU_07285, partial [Verrucomicrobiales bacterium]